VSFIKIDVKKAPLTLARRGQHPREIRCAYVKYASL